MGVKDRNIDSDAAIQIHKILGGANRVGQTLYCVSPGYYKNSVRQVPTFKYWAEDHLSRDFICDSMYDAVELLKSNKGYGTEGPAPQTIMVGPGKWQENVEIISLEGLKISGMTDGWAQQVRASDGAQDGAKALWTVSSASGYSVTAVCFAIMCRSVVLENMFLDADGGCWGAYVGDGYRHDNDLGENAASTLIRNCVFNKGAGGLLLDGASDNVRIYNNLFTQITSVGIQIDPGGDRQTQRPQIVGNDFVAISGYGIDMYSTVDTVNILVKQNTFLDKIAADPMTAGVRFQGGGSHFLIGNWFACATPWSAASTDYVSGNFGGTAGNGTAKVHEA